MENIVWEGITRVDYLWAGHVSFYKQQGVNKSDRTQCGGARSKETLNVALMDP